MNNNPIGIFDSGIGGLTVLDEAVKRLPHEEFIYFQDSQNFPYGDKDPAELKKIIIKNVETLVEKKCKAIVIACNTATSVAIEDLRKMFEIPIIGMEPAIKPALESKHKKVLVLATPVTLKLEKFNRLKSELDKDDDLIVLPAKGLAELIEKSVLGNLDKKEMEKYLTGLLNGVDEKEISTVVLGCTHYVFIKDLIKKIFSGKSVVDGNVGTVQHLKSILKERNLLNKKREKGSVCQINTK